MASPTTNLGMTYPAHGGSVNAWDTPLNADFEILDTLAGGTYSYTGGTASFGTAASLASSNANNCRIAVSGTLTNNFTITWPSSVGGTWVVDNTTTGNFAVNVRGPSVATAVACRQGYRTLVTCNSSTMTRGDDGNEARLYTYLGNPNGNVAGTAGGINGALTDFVWSPTFNTLYACTTSGSAAAAVWTDFVLRGFNMPVNLGLTVTHTGGNLLNVALKGSNGSDPSTTNPVIVPFQTLSGAATTGVPTSVSITSALSMDSNAVGATLGTSNSTAFRFWVALFNNGGTAVLAIMNARSGTNVMSITESGVASTTAISGAATSAGVWYTPNGTTLTNKAYRLIGYLEYTSGLATAGTYTSDPTNVVLFGPGVRKPGDEVQDIFTQYGTSGSDNGSSYSPSSTAPTTSNSYLVTSQDVTPSSACNLLEIELQLMIVGGAGGMAQTLALMQDATSSAISAASEHDASSGGQYLLLHLLHRMLSGTTSATTFKMYVAGSTTATIYWNRTTASSSNLFASKASTYIRIKEIMA